MGTRGFWSYRHNGWYFCRYANCDGYAEGLGLEIFELVPRCAVEFAAWIVNKRIELDEKLRKYRNGEDKHGDYDDDLDEHNSVYHSISQEQPQLERTYEIDLDNLVFWVNETPFFRLDNLPPTDIFLEIAATPKPRDRYGHYVPSSTTPAEYVVSHIRTPAPAIPALTLEAYTSLSAVEIPVVPIHDILGLQTQQTTSEIIRIRLLEVLVGNLMVGDDDSGSDGYIPKPMRAYRSVACGESRTPIKAYNAYKAFIAVIAHPPRLSYKSPSLLCDVNWPRPDVCFLLAFHLDDEPNLRASIVQLVKFVQEARQSSNMLIAAQQVIYGVLFDVWNCCIVKIHPDGHVVAHTGCLQFLPDYRLAENPHTPGITAMGRLFCRSGSGLFRAGSRLFGQQVQEVEPFSSHFPPEIVRHIALYLDDYKTVVNLSLVSDKWAKDVEADYWNRAVVNDRYRLLKALPWDPSKNHLASATFEAFDPQTDTTVDLSISYMSEVEKMCFNYHSIPDNATRTRLEITAYRRERHSEDIPFIAPEFFPREVILTLRVDLDGTLPPKMYLSDDED